jgi:hypothetical protein
MLFPFRAPGVRLYRWFVHNLRLNRPAVSKPKPNKPSRGSGLAVFGMLSVVSGAAALVAIGALAAAAGGSATAGVLAATAGVGSAATGVLAAAAGVGSAAAGVLAAAAGVGSATTGVLAAVVGVGSATAGALAAAAGVGSAMAGALAVAGVQVSEIIFTPVMTTLLSEAPEIVDAFVLCPMISTSWPTCGFRSTVLLVTLKL